MIDIITGNHKTYWCPKCNRFNVASLKSEKIPFCPKHNIQMVETPYDKSRTKNNAPYDNPFRYPKIARQLSEKELEKILYELSDYSSENKIVIIYNREDDDIKNYLVKKLLFSGYKNVMLSLPEPKYQWINKLDPDWTIKFEPILKSCFVAICICSFGTKLNNATKWEVDILKKYNKKILYCEYKSESKNEKEAIDFLCNEVNLKDMDGLKLLNYYRILSLLSYRAKNYEQTEFYYKKILTIGINEFGSENSCVANYYNDLGLLYKLQEKYEDSLIYIKKSLIIREKLFGTKHSATIYSYFNMAVVYLYKGYFKEAEDYFKNVLNILENDFKESHPITYPAYKNLAELYNYQGKLEKAELYYLKALVLKEKKLEIDHPYLATLYSSLGLVYNNQGKYEKAKVNYKRAFYIKEKDLGDNHIDLIYYCNILELICKYQEKYEESEFYHKKSIDIQKKNNLL